MRHLVRQRFSPPRPPFHPMRSIQRVHTQSRQGGLEAYWHRDSGLWPRSACSAGFWGLRAPDLPHLCVQLLYLAPFSCHLAHSSSPSPCHHTPEAPDHVGEHHVACLPPEVSVLTSHG